MNIIHQRVSFVAVPALFLALTGFVSVSSAEQVGQPAGTFGGNVDLPGQPANTMPITGGNVDQSGQTGNTRPIIRGNVDQSGQPADASPTMGGNVDQSGQPADARPTMGERVDQVGSSISDTAITAKVKGAFLADNSLKVLDIHVTTTDGVVALSGEVDSQQTIDHAEEVAAGVKDVDSVTNTMVVTAAR